MLYFAPWKVLLICGLCVLGVRDFRRNGTNGACRLEIVPRSGHIGRGRAGRGRM